MISMKKIKFVRICICAFLSFVFTMSCIVVNASELNLAYLNSEYWNGKDVTISNFDFGEDAPVGSISYFQDTVNNSIYVKTSFTQDVDLSQLNLHFNFYNDSADYHFAVDEFGMCDMQGNEADLFNIEYSLENEQIVAINIIDGSYINYLNISIYYNGRNYNVLKDLLIDATPITTEKTTTPKTTKEKTTKERTTKSPKERTTKVTQPRTQKYKSEITQYEPNYSNSDSASPQTENNYQSSSESYSVRNYKNRTGYLIAGTVLIVIAFCFLAYYIKNKNE